MVLLVCYYLTLTLTLTLVTPASSAVTFVDDGDSIECDDDDSSSDDGSGVIVITVVSAAGSVAAMLSPWFCLVASLDLFCSVLFCSVQYCGTVAL